ncbi:MAG: DUF1833 family protein [Henriciella sp.]|nr:DUF1833 family protein [Henriciella sp.]
MALTDRQRRYYASAPNGEYQQQGLSFYHPAFSQDWHFTDWREPFQAEVAGVLQTFDVHPFRVSLPKIDENGKYELKLDVYKTPQLVSELKSAAAYVATDPEALILATYNQYLVGDTAPQQDAVSLELTVAAIQGDWCTLTAARIDVVNKKFPNMFFRRDLLPGLDR